MKRLFIIGICLCLSGMVSAQWHVGCEVGANWSTVKFPSYEMGGKRMTGFNIGAVGMYRWSERWGLQANLMYTTRGYNVSDGVIIPGDEIIKDRVEDVAVESKYIDVPVVAKFYPGLGVHLDAGMQAGFLVGRTLKYGNSRQPSSLLGEKQPVDVGLVFGGGWESRNGVNVGLRYMLGLNSCYKKVDDFTNRSLMVTVDYLFCL